MPCCWMRRSGQGLQARMAHGIAWRRANRVREPEGAPFLRRDEPQSSRDRLAPWQAGPLLRHDSRRTNLKELQALPPKNVVLCMDLDDLMNADIRSTLLRLRAQGYGFMLRGASRHWGLRLFSPLPRMA